ARRARSLQPRSITRRFQSSNEVASRVAYRAPRHGVRLFGLGYAAADGVRTLRWRRRPGGIALAAPRPSRCGVGDRKGTGHAFGGRVTTVRRCALLVIARCSLCESEMRDM